MKTCSKCFLAKPLSEFSRYQKGTYVCMCRACATVASMAYQKSNPEKVRAARKRYRETHKLKLSGYNKIWVSKNAQYHRDRCKVRYDLKKLATPEWANTFFMKEAYHLARLRTKVMGYQWHVDHIVPLQNPLVCGLHVHNNLQVIPASVNWAKKNREWPDMPTGT